MILVRAIRNIRYNFNTKMFKRLYGIMPTEYRKGLSK